MSNWHGLSILCFLYYFVQARVWHVLIMWCVLSCFFCRYWDCGIVELSQSLWLPKVVLNQRQVFIVVSDWEPYLGSHILWVFRVWLFLSLCLHQIGCLGFRVTFLVLYCSCLLNMYQINTVHFGPILATPPLQRRRKTKTITVIVEVYLWWELQASLIFLSGRTCTIGGWLNTFLYVRQLWHRFFYISVKLDIGPIPMLAFSANILRFRHVHRYIVHPLPLEVTVNIPFSNHIIVCVRACVCNVNLLTTTNAQSQIEPIPYALGGD